MKMVKQLGSGEMNSLYVENLGIIITEKCNLNCAHCFRGNKQCRDISPEVIDAIFAQVRVIGILNICGGEPTMAIDKIEYLFNKIIEKKILVGNICITINGTIYSSKLIKLCECIYGYIKDFNPKGFIGIYVSYDKYHLEEMKRENICFCKENFNNPFFAGIRELGNNLKLFREGNGKSLDSNLTIPLRPMRFFVLDYSAKEGIITHKVGPFITINIDGTITEDNTTYENQQTIYNYGNILTDNLVDSLIDNGAKVVKKEIMYRILSKKEVNKFLSYNE